METWLIDLFTGKVLPLREADWDVINASSVHSSEQQWSLLPVHAIASTVRPAYFVYGTSSASGYSSIAFPAYVMQMHKARSPANYTLATQISRTEL